MKLITKKETLTLKEIKILARLAKGEAIRNCYYGSGRYTTKSNDFAAEAANLLRSLNIDAFFYENDAPRGGWSGKHTRLNCLIELKNPLLCKSIEIADAIQNKMASKEINKLKFELKVILKLTQNN